MQNTEIKRVMSFLGKRRHQLSPMTKEMRQEMQRRSVIKRKLNKQSCIKNMQN